MFSAHPPMRLFVLSFACLLAVGACGLDGMVEVPEHEVPGGVEPGNPANLRIEPVDWPASPRRGPVLLTADLVDPASRVTDVVVSFDSGEGWKPIRAMWSEREGGRLGWAWDSFADVAADGAVPLRLVASGPGVLVTLEQSIELRNAPDVDRIVLVAHPNVTVDGRGAMGHELGAFVWKGKVPEAAADSRRLSVGPAPERLRAAPHGRAVAVEISAHGEWAVDIVRTPLDARLSAVERSHTLALPQGTPQAFEWSPDGRYLWVLGNSPHALWRYEPSEDLSAWPEPERVADLPGPPMQIATDPIQGRLFIYCGNGGSGTDKLLLLDGQGEEIGRLETILGGANGLGVSADGTRGLWTGLWEDEVRFYSLQKGVEPLGEPVAFDSPFEPRFHPDRSSHAALVTSWDTSSVTSVVEGGGQVRKGTRVGSMPLAAELDVIERGPQTGTFLVPVLSEPASVRALRLDRAGEVERLSASIPLAAGFEGIPGGIAIQR